MLIFLLLFIFLPKKEYSKTENKLLSSFPKLSAETLFGKSVLKTQDENDDLRFTKKTEDYIKDHFPLKDRFVEIYALYGGAVKRSYCGNVLQGRDGYLLSEERDATGRQKENLASMERAFAEWAKTLPVTVAVSPTGSQYEKDKLPLLAPSSAIDGNRALLLETFGGGKNYAFVDLYEALAASGAEGLFYRTDHHWTTLGAYYGSAAIKKALGAEPKPLEHYRREIATEDFKGTLYNRSGAYWTRGERIEYFRYDGDGGYTVSFINARGAVTRTQEGFYNAECLKDDYHGTAYDSFVTPVGPMLTISNGEEGKKTLLVLKDSYAHCALPFLAEDFDLVVLDVRSHRAYAEQLIKDGAVDGILVLVSTDTLFG